MNNYTIPLTADEILGDMGSIKITKRDSNIYEFKGLDADKDKLPKVKAIGTGSTCLLIDTGVILMYEATSKTWYEL